MSYEARGRNFYYSGKFPGESDADVIERIALVNERDTLLREIEAVTRDYRIVYAQLSSYRSVLQRKREDERDND